MRRSRRANTSRYASRSRRIVGLLPTLGHGLAQLGGWAVRHVRLLALLAIVVGISWASWRSVRLAEAFRIRRIQQPSSTSFTLRSSLMGMNVWAVDLRALSQELRAQQPWLKDVRVVRQLPDTIRIDAIPRLPIAQVKLERWYPVDRDGFILPQGSASASETLVRFEGFDRGGSVLRAGKAGEDERLALALRVLQRLRRAPALISRKVEAVNVADPTQLRFVLQGGIEVRCSSEAELDAHLERLRSTLKALAKQPVDVAYIDLRFREPVIGTHTS